MKRKDEILKAALDYANHQKDIPIKDEFTKLLCTVLGQAFRDGAMWADETRRKNKKKDYEDIIDKHLYGKEPEMEDVDDLLNIEVKPLFKVGDKVCQKKDRDFVVIINSITNGLYLCDVYDKDGDYDDDYCFSVSDQNQWELVDITQAERDKAKEMITWPEKQGGQKLGRWSDDDDWNTQVFINALELYNSPVDKVLLKSWIKSFKYRCKSQSKQEWSEEDKEITRSLLDIIYECHSYGKCALKLNEYSKLCNWLRFLKERCCPQKLSNVERNGEKWKPSDEQLEALMNQCINTKSTETGAFLCDLYYDLKKL